MKTLLNPTLLGLFLFAFQLGYAQIFTDVAQSAGMQHLFDTQDFVFGGGAIVFDFDNDNDEDLYVAGGAGQDALFRNNGDGTFTNVSTLAGFAITAQFNTQGGSAADIDNDGDRDLFIAVRGPVTDSNATAPNFLFINNGDGTFSDISTSSGIGADNNFSTTGAWGDVNQDGFLDLYVCNYLKDPVYTNFTTQGNFTALPPTTLDLSGNPNSLFINNGDNTFTEDNSGYGCGSLGSPWQGTFTDYDLDGDLDIYTANDFGALNYSNSLYQNNFPNADFTDQAAFSGTDYGIGAMGIAIGDYDLDGYQDIYVTNTGFNLLLHNLGNGTFEEVANAAGVDEVTLSYGNMPLRFCHTYQPDPGYTGLDTSWFVSCMGPVCDTIMNVLFTDIPANYPGMNMNSNLQGKIVTTIKQDSSETICFVIQNPSACDTLFGPKHGTLINKTTDTLTVSNGWGCNFTDFDNDGYLDLFVSNGSLVAEMDILMSVTDHLPNSFYRNLGNGSFEDISAQAGVKNLWRARGSVQFDYDNDGDEDLVVINQDWTNLDTVSSTPNILLYRNDDVNSNHHFRVKLQGVVANRDGIGSKVYIVAGGKKMLQEIDGGSSSQSHNSIIAHFGLGNSTVIDSLIIMWSGSGSDTLTNLNSDQTVLIVEGLGVGTVDRIFSNLVLYPNPAGESLQLKWNASEMLDFEIIISDALGRLISKQQVTKSSYTLETTLKGWKQLNTGMYFVSIHAGNLQTTYKVMKE